MRPALGHLPARDDEVLLSYNFWQAEFHGDPTIAGRVLRLNRQPFTIAGVLPRAFNGISVESGPQVHLLADAAQPGIEGGDPRTCCQWEVAGRLRPGVTLAAATREAPTPCTPRSIGRHTDQAAERGGPRLHRTTEVSGGAAGARRLAPARSVWFGPPRALRGAVLLLLLACANIAGMMVARAAAREREMALRAALGATRRAAGTALARRKLYGCDWAVSPGSRSPLRRSRWSRAACRRLRDLATYLVPVALDLRLDWRVFAFAFGSVRAGGALAGIAPAWHSTRVALNESLKATAGDPRRARLRSVLTIVQVAICTVVLANSALLIATLRALRAAPAGFDRDRVITFNVDTPSSPDLALRLEREARALPGVEGAALAARSLMRGSGLKTSVGLPGKRNGRDLNASLNAVSSGLLRHHGGAHPSRTRVSRPAMACADRKPGLVIVNQAFVRRFLPGADPIGRTFGTASTGHAAPDFEIVGVVSDTRYRSLREPFQPISTSASAMPRRASRAGSRWRCAPPPGPRP